MILCRRPHGISSLSISPGITLIPPASGFSGGQPRALALGRPASGGRSHRRPCAGSPAGSSRRRRVKCPPPPLTSARESGIRLSIASLSASTTEPWKSVGWSVGWDDMLTCFVSLVAWNRGIDALRPRVDSALEVINILEAGAKQLLSDGLAATAMMTMKRDRSGTVETRQVFLASCIERTCPGDLGDHSLILWSDIEEDDLRAIEHQLERSCAQLLHPRWGVWVGDLKSRGRSVHKVEVDTFSAARARAIHEESQSVNGDLDVVRPTRPDEDFRFKLSANPQVQRAPTRVYKGRFERFDGRVANRHRRRVGCFAFHAKKPVKLPRRIHLTDNVAAANEFPIDIHLGYRRPLGELLDAVAQFGRSKHVDRFVVQQAPIEDLHDLRREPALRRLARALHEEDHAIGCKQVGELLSDRFGQCHRCSSASSSGSSASSLSGRGVDRLPGRQRTRPS